jgi:hypothetical protein
MNFLISAGMDFAEVLLVQEVVADHETLFAFG